MARADFNAELNVRQQYLSMLFHKIPGEAAWTLMDQGKIATPDATADEKTYDRIGDEDQLTVAGQIKNSVTLQVYVDDHLDEVARVLGYVRPGGGWLGTENIKLDPTKVSDIKLESYNGVAVGSALLFTECVNSFRPLKFSIPEDASGDVRIAELSGSCTSYYIIPVAG
jgi:hypothetical protein